MAGSEARRLLQLRADEEQLRLVLVLVASAVRPKAVVGTKTFGRSGLGSLVWSGYPVCERHKRSWKGDRPPHNREHKENGKVISNGHGGHDWGHSRRTMGVPVMLTHFIPR
jgi:hypothetical protein